MSSELREEIELGLAELRQLLGSFRPLREKILNVTPEFVEISALAGFLHAFYTGIENLFKRIAIHLDGAPPRGEAWHTHQMTDQMRELIKKAAEALKEAGAREVYLFGSAATGNMREESDIDMAVSGLPPEKFFQAMGNAGDILRRPLDLVDLDEDSPFTRYLIEEKELKRVE